MKKTDLELLKAKKLENRHRVEQQSARQGKESPAQDRRSDGSASGTMPAGGLLSRLLGKAISSAKK